MRVSVCYSIVNHPRRRGTHLRRPRRLLGGPRLQPQRDSRAQWCRDGEGTNRHAGTALLACHKCRGLSDSPDALQLWTRGGFGLLTAPATCYGLAISRRA